MNNTSLSPQLEDISRRLADLGYREPTGALLPNYRYAAGGGKEGRADLVAFGSAQHWDISTSCITVQTLPNGDSKLAMLSEVRHVGTPVILFAAAEDVEVWTVARNDGGQHRQSATVSYDRLAEFFQNKGRELSPQVLLPAKRGELQLTFFDIDPSLTEFARVATQQTLVEQFARALLAVPNDIREKKTGAVTRLAIYTLAACILQDKLPDYPYLDAPNASVLLYALRQRFPHYFAHLPQDLKSVGADTVMRLYGALRTGFTFRSLTNDMLAYFYENTLVDPKSRKALGIYYTPRSLARDILARLPIEDIAPENRTVLDGTCGSGNLLLAAYDRLDALLPMRWTSHERHDYLLHHLWGVDKDSFACEVARLSLLIRSLPAGDSWKVNTNDVFHVDPAETFGGTPHIIVGNPPFAEPHTVKGGHQQKAAAVLDRYLEWLAPGGLLGIVLPITFLENTSAKETRRRLLETCDVLEIWHLPEGAIPSSGIATAVVLVRKLPQPTGKDHRLLTRIEERFRPRRLQRPEDRALATRYVVRQGSWFDSPNQRMRSSSLQSLWERIEQQFPPLHGDIAMVHNGVQIGKRARATHLSATDQGEDWRPVLNSNSGGLALEPFSIRWTIQEQPYIKYPSKELRREGNPEHFQRPVKLIVNAQRNAGSPWRFFAAIDRDRLVVTENFHYILPKSATPEQLVGVLNSMPANAWYATKTGQWNVREATLKLLPFPSFTSQQSRTLQSIVSRISRLKQSAEPQALHALRDLFTRLDDIVFAAYGISGEERMHIRAEMDYYVRPGVIPEGEMEWEDDGEGANMPSPFHEVGGRFWLLTGEVESIDAERRTVKVWLQGRNGSTSMSIPPSMPGWALRPGAAFQVRIPWEERARADVANLTWIEFQPLDLGYLSYEDLLSHLSAAQIG